jgi:hypothetical protein
MQAKPRKTKKELTNNLPDRIAKLYGESGIADSGGLEQHGKLDLLEADPLKRTVPPNADRENRDLAAAIRAAFRAAGKPNDDLLDPDKGPRFVLTWRMYPNKNNTKVGVLGSCGCGCSCGG